MTINVNKTDKPKSVKTKRIKINFSNNINIGSGGKNLFHSIYEPRLYNERILKNGKNQVIKIGINYLQKVEQLQMKKWKKLKYQLKKKLKN